MTAMAGPQTFTATIEPRQRGSVAILMPFDPSAAWGDKDRHYVAGTIGGHGVRGVLTEVEDRYYLQLGPSWCRAPDVAAGTTVTVVLGPEGPQFETVADDLREALGAEPGARRFFESLATFYRNGFVDWIESAKRPETRANRIAETVTALKAGRREH